MVDRLWSFLLLLLFCLKEIVFACRFHTKSQNAYWLVNAYLHCCALRKSYCACSPSPSPSIYKYDNHETMATNGEALLWKNEITTIVWHICGAC